MNYRLRLNKALYAIIALIAILIIANEPAYSQFNILKKAKEAVKESTETKDKVETQGCDPLIMARKKLDDLKLWLENIDDNGKSLIPSYLQRCKTHFEDARTGCPDKNLAPYEEELAGYQKQWDEFMSGEGNKESAAMYIHESSRDLDKIEGHFGGWVGMFAKKEYGQAFYNSCKEVDYPARKTKIEDIMKKYPELMHKGYEPQIDYERFTQEFPEKFKSKIEEYFKKEINLAVEGAYENKKNNRLSDALGSAQSAVLVCDGILLTFPDMTDIQDLKKEAEATVNKMGGEYGSRIYTSEFHKANAGKIVFSKNPIEIKKENPGAMSDKFVAGDYIYGMIYLKDTFENLVPGQYVCDQNVYVDDKEVASHSFQVDRDQWNATYLYTEIIADPNIKKTNGTVKYTDGLASISPRKHKVKVVLLGGSTSLIASGEFDFDCSGAIEKVEAQAKALKNKVLEAVRMPEAKMKDAALEKAMLAALSDWPEKPLRVVITESEWTVHRTALGIIDYRWISTAVALKTPEGPCKIFYLSFKQDSNGSSYGKTQSWGVGDSEEIPCDNVNK